MKKKELKTILSIAMITIMCATVTACGQQTSSTVTSAEAETAVTQEMSHGEALGNPPGNPPGGGGFGGGSSADIDYSGAVEVTGSDTQDGKTYESTKADESALLVSTSDDVTITDATVTKTGDSDGGDNCNFYGLNAAVLVKDGSTTTITGAIITSDADGANGVFSYGGNGGTNGAEGDGTTVIISDSTITTTGDGSGGIMTTGGGVTKASNLTVETSGRSSAAIRTDRGGGTVTLDGGTLTSLNGHVFHVTNTTAVINLDNVKIVNKDSENILLSVCADGWNGDTNTATLNASNQTLEGTILVGSDSQLTLNLTDESSFTGTIGGNITNAKGKTVSTEVGTVSVSIDKSSTWTLTADTYISSFDGDISSVITNGYTLYVNGVAMN